MHRVWMAVGLWSVTAVGCASVARAAPEAWTWSGTELLKMDDLAQGMYFMGVMDGFAQTDSVRCPAGLRKGAIMFQAKTLLKERPAPVALENLIDAMGQLGCRWTKPTPSGPSS